MPTSPAVIQGIQTAGLRPIPLNKIWLKRQGSGSTNLLALAPITTVPSVNGFYHYFDENGVINTGGAADPTVPKSFDQPATPGGLKITSAAYTVNNYAWGAQVITEDDEREFAARGESAIAIFTDKLARQGVQHHAKTFGAVIAASGSYSAGAISGPALGTTPSGDLIGAVNTALEQFVASGLDLDEGEWAAVCNDVTYNTLIKAYQVATYGAVAAYSGSSQRLGYADRSAVDQFFARAFFRPLKLTVSTHTYQNLAGTVTRVIPDGLLSIFKVADGLGSSGFLQTFVTDASGATGRVVSYPAYNPVGTGVYVKNQYGIVTLGGASKFGQRITGLTS